MKRLSHCILFVIAASLSVMTTPAQEQEQLCGARVATEPPGAAVYFDGVMRGETPADLTGLAPGEHLIVVNKPGYHEARRTVALTRGQRATLDLKLEPVFGLVLVHSTPPGAEAQIAGADRGKTPLLIHDLPLGEYRMRLALPGYIPKELALSLKDRTPIKIATTLTSDTATLVLNSTPSDAKVTLNGIARGTTPCTLDRIPAGDNVLTLESDGHEFYTQTLKLSAGEKQELTAVLQPIPAELTVVSIPTKARVYVNNQFRGEAPVSLQKLEPGTYSIRAELPAHEPMLRTVVLKHADKVVEEFRLQRNTGGLEITTEPAGARVFIDGKESGVTSATSNETDRISDPLKIEHLQIGAREVKLTKKGYYDQTFSVNVEKNKTVTAHHQMKRRFIPNCEATTVEGIYRGVLIESDGQGNIRLELRPGIFKNIPAQEIKALKPLREQPPVSSSEQNADNDSDSHENEENERLKSLDAGEQ